MKQWGVLLLGLILVGLLIAFVINTPTGLIVEEKNTVKIGYNNLAFSSPIFVAVENGYFKERGVTVELVRFETGQLLAEAIVNNQVDAGGYTALPIVYPIDTKSSNPLIISSISLHDKEHPIDFIIVRKNSTIKTFDDLEGKSIGVFPTAAVKFYAGSVLQENDVKNYTIQLIAPQLLVPSLESGAVDAIYTAEPIATVALIRGVGRLLTNETIKLHLINPFPNTAFVFSKVFADENPENVRGIIQSIDKAIDFIETNQDKNREILPKYLDPVFADLAPNFTDLEYWKSDELDMGNLQSFADILFENDLLEVRINVSQYIITD